MNKNGLFIAAMLDSASKAYAAGTATRMVEADSGLAAGMSFTARTIELELHLRLLAESLAAGHPALFANEAKWLKLLYLARGEDWRGLLTELDCLHGELLDRLPGSAHDLVTAHIVAAQTSLPGAPETIPGYIEDEASPHIELRRRFLLAILESRGDDAVARITEAADSGIGVDELQDHVITPVQQELGRMWHLGEIHVGEEHFGTRITNECLSLLRARLPRPTADARRVLIAGTSGSQHDVGLRIAADRLRMAGWRPIELGADVPQEDCVRSARDGEVDLVALSIPMLLNLRKGYETIVSLKSAGLPVLVGGRILDVVDDLWEVLGADAVSRTAKDAAEAAERAVASAS